MATVSSITISAPTSDPNITEGNNFTFEITVNDASHGAMDYDLHWQWDQGTATWQDIPSSGGLSTADTNPILNHTVKGATSITVTGNTAGSYNIRGRTIDHNDGDAEDLTSSQAVTVNAATGRRRIIIC